MSTLKAEVVALDGVALHPGADRLSLATVKGWQCVVPRGRYSQGDKVIYVPVDAVLSAETEARIFPPDSKVKLTKSRIRTIKLRGAVSQGLVVDPELFDMQELAVGTDVTGALGITKYEPEESSLPRHMQAGQKAKKRATNPHFSKYNDTENLKNYMNVFEDGELVYVTEKLHGTSSRYGMLPVEADTLWKKFKKLLGMLPSHEFCYGSRNVQLQSKFLYNGFYDTNVYAKIAKQLDLQNLLKPGEALYGEIVGDGIQKGYTYGCGKDEHKFFAYDVKVDGRWLDSTEFTQWCDARSIPRVPTLYIGPYNYEQMLRLRDGDSTIGGQKIREGVVVKSFKEAIAYCGRKSLKFISDNYYLGEQSEWH